MKRTQLAAVVVWAVMAVARVAEALTITVIAPTPTTRIRDKVDVYVNAETAFELTAAQVTLDGATEQLTPFASCGPGCVRLFAELAAATPDGTKRLTVELADASGATAATEAPFILDRPVVVTLAVKPGTVTGTAMRFRGTCDDNGAPCASVDLSINATRMEIKRTLVDVTAFDELFDLAPVANQTVLAVAVGRDGFPGGESVRTATVHVNDSPRLVQIVQTAGAIFDADLRRVLHGNPFNLLSGPPGISIFDRSTGMDTLVNAQASDFAALTPNGALWPGPDNGTTIYRDGMAETFPGNGARIAGVYVQWQESAGFILHWMNVATGAHIQLNNVGPALPAANGTLYYMRRGTGDLIRRDGTGESLVGTSLFPVATDGNLLVAQPSGACGLDVYGSTGLIDHLDTSPCSAVQGIAWVRAGWVVYFESQALPAPPFVKFSLHSRGPDGARYRLADELFSRGLDDVSPSGDVMFREGTRRFLVSPGGTPVEVAGSLGRGMWRDGHWLVAISDTLFALDAVPPIPAPPDGAPDASPDGAPDASPGPPDPPNDAGPGAESDANPGPGGGLNDGGGCGGCSTGAAPPSLLVLVAWLWLRRKQPRRGG